MSSSIDDSFPLETVENIASFLWHDRTSLSHCKLVSHRWYTAVRPLLFRRVTVKSWKRLADLESLLSKEPVIGYWIRELCVDASEDRQSGWLFRPHTNVGTVIAETDSTIPFPGPVLAKGLKRLYTLAFVHVHGVEGNDTARGIATISKAFASTVRSLTFKSCIGHTSFFLAFVHAFPLVRDVQYSNTTTRGIVPENIPFTILPLNDRMNFHSCIGRRDPSSPHINLPLRSVRIDHHDFIQLDGLLCLESLSTLHTLEIRHTGVRLHPVDEISNKILPQCGRGLRTLKLFIVNMPLASHTKRFEVLWLPSFTHLKGLRVLELNLSPLYHPFVGSLLDTCQRWCTKLVTLVFHVFFGSPLDRDLLPVYFVPLDERLKSSSLKEVCFRYEGPCNWDEVHAWVQNSFPRLTHAEEKGKLRIRVEKMTTPFHST